MQDGKTITDLEVINAPWNTELTVSNVEYEGGFKMLRVRVKQGKRFTDLELDFETATHIAEMMGKWAKDNTPAE